MTEFTSPALSLLICMLGSILALYARTKVKTATASNPESPKA